MLFDNWLYFVCCYLHFTTMLQQGMKERIIMVIKNQRSKERNKLYQDINANSSVETQTERETSSKQTKTNRILTDRKTSTKQKSNIQTGATLSKCLPTISFCMFGERGEGALPKIASAPGKLQWKVIM